MGAHYGGPNAMSFPQWVYFHASQLGVCSHPFDRWLGQNSKRNKLSRQLGDVQIRMRLKVSGDKSEIRQSYIPALFPHIVKPLIDVGVVCSFFRLLSPDTDSHSPQSAVDQVIERMDDYYLSKEDWDTILELGVDDKKDQIVAKNISTATKSALTKKWVVIHSGCFAQ